MHSFIVSTNPELPVSTDVLHIQPDPSIGIEAIRDMQTFLSKRPTEQSFSTVVVHDAHLLTLPAQHAILKILEEPPNNSQIYLVTSNPDTLIPTILSRVQLTHSESKSPEVDSTWAQKILDNLKNKNLKDKLTVTEEQAFTRETALQFLNQLEHILHSDLHVSKTQTISYTAIETTRKYLKANCNLKLTLDNLIISAGFQKPYQPMPQI